VGNYPFSEQGGTVTPAYVLPSGDPTGVADDANIAVAIAKGYTLAPGTFYVTNLLIDSRQLLAGSGPGTILQAVAGTTGYMVALKTPATTYQATIRDLTLIPNTGSLGGVQLDNTGFTSGGGETDSQHTLQNVYVQNAGANGFHFDNNIRSLRMTRCMQYGAGSDGFYIGVGCTDSSFTGCISGPSVGHSWNFLGWNNYVSSCKGFFAGWNGSVYSNAAACCWEIGANAANNTFVSCSAQNASLHGWDLQSCTNNAIVGCESDGNSAKSGNTGCGVNTNTATYCTIIGMTGEADGTQVYGIQVAGTQTNTSFIANTVAGMTGHFNYVSGGSYFLMDADDADFSGLSFFKTPLMTMDGGSSTANSAPVLTALGAVSGTAIQLADTTRDYMVYLECTTAGTATTVGMGHTNAANDVEIMNNAPISTGVVSFRLPAGWYFKWSGTTTAFANQNAVGC
jgi:hypothetical protein